MSVEEVGNSTVAVFGRPTDLSESIVTSLEHQGFVARRGRLPEDPTSVRSRWRTGESVSVQLTVADDSTDSIVIVIDEESAESLFNRRRLCTSSRQLAVYENDASELAVTTALEVGARRLLMTFDGRRLSFGQRARAIGWLRNLLRRIGYECSINGTHGLATCYTMIDTDDDVRRTAGAVVTWHGGREPIGAVREIGTESSSPGRRIAQPIA